MNICCRCGNEMELTLRTIIHARKVEIHHVPVFTCSHCGHSELVPEIKAEVVRLMQQSTGSESSNRIQIFFEEEHEAARVFMDCLEQGGEDLETLYGLNAEERVNQLLDVYLVAQFYQDRNWLMDIERRLKQINGVRVRRYQAS